MRFLVITLCLNFCILSLYGQDDLKLLRKGNSQYLDKSFEEAELSYRKALDKNLDRQETVYNLGNSLYQQERYKDAVMRFEDSITDFENDDERALAYHNLGNSLLSETLKKIDSEQPVAADSLNASINAFKEALKLNPKDADARYNLTYAQFIKSKLQKQEQDKQCNNPQQSDDGEKQDKKEEQEQKEQEQQEQEQQEQEEEEEEEQEEEEEEQEQKEQGEEEEEQEQEEQQEGEQEQQEEQEQEEEEQQAQDQQAEEQPAEVKELTKEEAERLLEALLNEEMKVQEKILKAKMPQKRQKIEKDW